MKYRYTYSALATALLFISLSFISCKKNNPAAKTTLFGKIGYFANAYTSPDRKVDGLKTDSVNNALNINWCSATVWVEKINFVGKNGTTLDTTIAVGKNIDIFDTATLIDVIQLPTGTYNDIDVKMYCRKSPKSELAFNFKGTFINPVGITDSLMVGSSFPFEAKLHVNDITINPSDHYKAVFQFDLTKVLTGISLQDLVSKARYYTINNKREYVIWKGGSADEPFYNQVIQNWQDVASINITKDDSNPVW